MKRFMCFIFAVAFCWPGLAAAGADISVSLKLDRSEATLVDSVRLVVSIRGVQGNAPQPGLQGVDLFEVQPAGTSSRVQITNGKVDSSVDYTYFLQPKHTGTFHIGPALITIRGKTFRSNTVRLHVGRPSQAEANRGSLFLTAEISSNRVYVGEQAIYTLKLFHRVETRDVSLDLPHLESAVFVQLGEPKEYQTLRNGRNYDVIEVRYAVTPSREGTCAIGPAKMGMTVPEVQGRSSRDPFSDPFFRDFFSFRSGRPISVASEPLELEVLPLPAAGRPADFSGLVGRFEMKGRLEPAKVKAGESATLTVQIRGLGDVKHVPNLQMPELNGVKVYADQPVLNAEQTPDGVAGDKTMKWALVPEKAGHVEVPPLLLSYFDTRVGRYRILNTPIFELDVAPGQASAAPIRPKEAASKPRASFKQAVKELGRDILPVHATLKDFPGKRGLMPPLPLFLALVFGPPFLYMMIFAVARFRRQSDKAFAAASVRTAQKNFLKKCRISHLTAAGLIRNAREYLNDRFGLSLGSVTPDEAARILRSHGADPDTAEGFRAMLQRLEDAVYTGNGEKACSAEGAPELVIRIEKEVR